MRDFKKKQEHNHHLGGIQVKRSKKLVIAMLVASLLLLLTACGGSATTSGTNESANGSSSNAAEDKGSATGFGKHTIKVANYYADDHPQNIALKEVFKPMIEEKTGGAIKVDIFPNSQIGNEEAFSEGVRNGTIEMAVFGTILSATEPKIGVTDMPFLIRDYEHAKQVFNGEVGDEIGDAYRKLGIEPLAWSANGFRVVSSSKPLYSIDDFKGLRLRMPNVPVYIEIGKALHANVSPMPISEVFTALESNVIDAQENPYATLRASGWYEVQDYVLESYHLFGVAMLGINQQFWNGLNAEAKEVIQEAAKETAEYEWKLHEEQDEETKQYLTEQGLEIIVPDEDFKKAMHEAVEPVYEEYLKKYDWAEELIEKIRNQ
ncbi:TRAP transporter substrate-binding protein [bacterium LRH843]|nr:TRAP transporter substrate-binding protein [bacterium LRH843]